MNTEMVHGLAWAFGAIVSNTRPTAAQFRQTVEAWQELAGYGMHIQPMKN